MHMRTNQSDFVDVKLRSARTALGSRLRAIRSKIVQSGDPLLDAKGLEREIKKRRGDQLFQQF